MVNIDSEVVGFIDVGTNSIHLLVVRFYKGSLGTTIFQDKESVRLGESLYKNGLLDSETIRKATLVIKNFADTSKNMGAERVIVLATCAAREAQNKMDFLESVRCTGIEINVISGMEEARLIRLGVFGPNGYNKNCLGIDIGGGSTEIFLCNGEKDLLLDSLSMGAVRFSNSLDIDKNKMLSVEKYNDIKLQVNLLSYRACREVKKIGFEVAYGSSGTMIALAELCAAKRDKDSSYMMHYELVDVMKELCECDLKNRKKIPGMSPARADIIIAGGAIAEELMQILNIDRIEISHEGLKQGMKIDYLLSKGHKDFNIKDSSVKTLANRCQYDSSHAEIVQKNSIMLFDSMKNMGIHNMGDNMRSLLSYAALLHDIGEFINYHKHNLHSYSIILNSFMPGFVDEELKNIALMARFHHKKFPDINSKYFLDMYPEQINYVLKCSLILKIADILDRHHSASITLINLNVIGDTVELKLESDRDISMEIWKLKSIQEDFKNVFGLNLEIKSQSNVIYS